MERKLFDEDGHWHECEDCDDTDAYAPHDWDDGEITTAATCGADGVMIEVHNDPEHALCDGPQSIRPEQFAKISAKLCALHGFMKTMED